MKVIGSSILGKKIDDDSSKLKEKLSGFTITEDVSEFDKYSVISVGGDVKEVKAGDVIYVSPNYRKRQIEITENSEVYYIISVSDVIAIS